MRLKRFIAVSTLLLLCALRAVACGPCPIVLPADYDLYRLLPYYAELKEPADGRMQTNCRLWMEAVPGTKYDEVRQAIYEFNLADWQRVERGEDCGNAFCRKLIANKDNDAVRLLVWSKYYEQWSEQMRSPWYYGCGMDDGGLDIDKIVAVASQAKGRYADRYLLLAMKCLYRSGRNEDCEALWKKRQSVLKKGFLRDQAEGYLAACLNRMGRKQEAVDIYSRLGDAASLQLIQDDKVAVFEQVMRYRPNSPFFPMALQRVLFVVENYTVDNRFSSYTLDSLQLRRLLDVASRAGKDPRVKNQPMWRYAAACLLDHMGRQREALAMVEGLTSTDDFLNASIRTLRIYLHSCLDAIDARYEQRLFADLQWLDSRMKVEWEGLDSTSRYIMLHIGDYDNCFRTVYANDALRRIVLRKGGLADRFAAAGRTNRALQLANMADNRFFQLTGNSVLKAFRTPGPLSVEYDWIDDETRSYDGYGPTVVRAVLRTKLDFSDITWLPWNFRYQFYPGYNMHDFSNRLFLRVDLMNADKLAGYWQQVLKPSDKMGQWLNERGYVEKDYWYDIIGTHLLRELRYEEAYRWLAKVSPQYQQCLNTDEYMRFDPFEYGEVETGRVDNYKVNSAKRLADLQRQSREAASPDDRADALLTLSIALSNMFNLNESFTGRCWPLVSYGFDYFDGQLSDWYGDEDPRDNRYLQPYMAADDAVMPYARQAKKEAQRLRKEAFRTYADPERKAQALRRVYEYTYLMQHLANTPTGQDIARHCDKWKDYRR